MVVTLDTAGATMLTDATVRMPRAFAFRVLVDGEPSGVYLHVSNDPTDAVPTSDAVLTAVAAQVGAAISFASKTKSGGL